MDKRQRMIKTIRWVLGVFLVVVGLSTTWAWGEVARLAGPAPAAEQPPVVALYAAWQPDGAERAGLFRSTDEGATWQPLVLPAGTAPVTWADDGKRQVAVVTEGGSLLLSEDQGESWLTVETGLDILSLAWDNDDSLYLGTDGLGVYRLSTDAALVLSDMTQNQPLAGQIVGLSLVEGRLFAATPNAVVYTDDTGRSAVRFAWIRSGLLPDMATTIVATDKQTVYAGTATTGLYKSTDAGVTWQPAWEGLGLAAGQMVRVTALRADPSEPSVLYVAVDHIVGSTQVYASAGGVFATVDGATSWQPMSGPSFPEARHASSLVLVPGKQLYARAVTEQGLQGYTPDVTRILAALESQDPKMRASAARQLGLARPMGVWNELLAALDDPEPAVSFVAADALGQINDPAAVAGLLLALEHPSEQVRLGAARALGMMQVEAAVEPLRTSLLRGDGLEVSVATEALARIGGQAATDALMTALVDPEPTARWHAAMAALEGMGEPAVAPLVALLASDDARARRNAAEALGWVGSPSATAALVTTLKQDREASVRGQAAWALGEIGDPAGRKALEHAQQRDPAATVQAEATWALTRVPYQRVATSSWAASWARTLNRLQPVRWLILALSLLGSALLMMGSRSLVTVPLQLWHRVR